MELVLGRKMRLPAVTDFNLCEPVLFKPTSTKRTVSATFNIRREMNTSFILLENINETVLFSDNQTAGLKPDDIKTEPTDQQSTDSHSENSRDKLDVSSPNSNEQTSVEQLSGATTTSSRNKKKNPKDLEKLGEQCVKCKKLH